MRLTALFNKVQIIKKRYCKYLSQGMFGTTLALANSAILNKEGPSAIWTAAPKTVI